MKSADRGSSFRAQLLDEISEEIGRLEGEPLDEYLRDVGLDPKGLLVDFEMSLKLLATSHGRRRFDEARAMLAASPSPSAGKLLDLDVARKRSVFAAVKERMDATGEMTVAARNRKITSEEDLDSFLQACVRLGVIDENGELKD